MIFRQGHKDNLIDRFDVRAHLDIIPESSAGLVLETEENAVVSQVTLLRKFIVFSAPSQSYSIFCSFAKLLLNVISLCITTTPPQKCCYERWRTLATNDLVGLFVSLSSQQYPEQEPCPELC